MDFDVAYIGCLLRLLEEEQIDFGLSEIDAALETLLTRFKEAELGEQIRDLFSTDPILSPAKWDRALDESLQIYPNQRRLRRRASLVFGLVTCGPGGGCR